MNTCLRDYHQIRVPLIPTLSLLRQYDNNTYLHCIRVENYVRKVLNSFGIRNENLCQAALVHDIGKTYIDKNIINKPGKLTEDERKLIDYHSYFGYLYLLDNGFSMDVCKYTLFHHGKKDAWKDYIEMVSEPSVFFTDILRACDIYDAMTSDRPYRKGVSKLIAIDTLEKNHINDNIIDHIGVI